MRILKKAVASLWVILAVAGAARVGFAWVRAREIPATVLARVPFQTETGHIAYSVASGKGYASPYERDTGPTAWLTPVYPLLLAAIFKVFGAYTRAAFFAAVGWNVACSVATCVPVFFLGRRLGGLAAGSAAAWLWAIFPNAVMIPFEWVWDTSLAALLAAVILWVTVEIAGSRRCRDWIGYGGLWGLALMTNAALGAGLPVLLGWLWWVGDGERGSGASSGNVADAERRSAGPAQARGRNFVGVAVTLGVTVLCCVPWTVRNYLVFGRFVPLRSNLGFELYVGNNENYDESRRGLPPVVTDEREILRYLRDGEVTFVDEEMRKALEFMRTHPRIEMELFAKRVVAFWMGTATPLEAFRGTDSILARIVLVGNCLTFMGTIAGIGALLWRRSFYAFPVTAFVVVFPLLYYATHTSLRYRHPVDPVVSVLVAVGICGAIQALQRKNREANHGH